MSSVTEELYAACDAEFFAEIDHAIKLLEGKRQEAVDRLDEQLAAHNRKAYEERTNRYEHYIDNNS